MINDPKHKGRGQGYSVRSYEVHNPGFHCVPDPTHLTQTNESLRSNRLAVTFISFHARVWKQEHIENLLDGRP